MSETVTASDGVNLPLDSLPKVLAYSGANVTTITVVYRGITYVQTFTYTGDNVTGISRWVAQ